MNWKPGDRAIVKGSWYPECNGSVVTIMSFPFFDDVYQSDCVIISGVPRFTEALTKVLYPIDDDYDGWEKTTWDKLPLECRPKELIRVD